MALLLVVSTPSRSKSLPHSKFGRVPFATGKLKLAAVCFSSVWLTLSCLLYTSSKPKSPKFIIVDSFQVGCDDKGWTYPDTVSLMKRFNRKCFIFISQEDKSCLLYTSRCV